jgi:aryl-alcohol dehydrogenase-like predicted oxidoreductase
MRREDVVITTKAPFSFSNSHSTAEGLVASLDKSLRQLDTDYIDVYQLHGVPPNAYDHALSELAPVVLRQKANGKLRYLGITETAPHDPEHQVLHRAAQDGVWDVSDAAHTIRAGVCKQRKAWLAKLSTGSARSSNE